MDRWVLFYAYLYSSAPEEISIDIKHDDYMKLAYNRKVALIKGFLIRSEDDYVPAKIRYKDKTIPVKLRLKGDYTDHLEGDKWSFRVVVKGDNTLFGMKQFSIQHPKTRNYAYEWLFHKLLKREDVISLRYDFIDVTLNGKHLGVYALEEHFRKRLIENNKLREGPIIRFSEDMLWEERVFLAKQSDPKPTWSGSGSYFSSNVDAFGSDGIDADPKLSNQYRTARHLLESWRDGSLPTHKVFDVKKLAKFFAITDLTGAQHATIWHNMRFYYNPVTSLLEPIGFDANAGQKGYALVGAANYMREIDDTLGDDVLSYYGTFFSDPIFFSQYIKELERVSEPKYLDTFFKAIDKQLNEKLSIIRREFPSRGLSKDYFYQRQGYIRDIILNPPKVLHAYFNQYNETSGTVVIDVGNIQYMPIELLSVRINGKNKLSPKLKDVIIRPKSPGKPVRYTKVEFVLPNNLQWREEYKSKLELECRILGASKTHSLQVHPKTYFDKDKLFVDLRRQAPNPEQFDFLVVNTADKRITIKPGDWQLNKDLVIPEGYQFICGAETRLDLISSASIISYSPLRFIGEPDSQVIISSSDSTGQGVTAIGAGKESILKYVVFENLGSLSRQGWELTGAVTFYESPIKIFNCRFVKNRSEDGLNIVRSKFEIHESLFKDTQSDALDIDFGEGLLSKPIFLNCGNDGADFSGSRVIVKDCFVDKAGDKGISVGENSSVSVTNIEIKDCNIATAAKDLSTLRIKGLKVFNSRIGFTAFQKKPEFGSSTIYVDTFEIKDTKTIHLIEKNSKLVLGDKEIAGDKTDVADKLYK